jgi:hypothetical protein
MADAPLKPVAGVGVEDTNGDERRAYEEVDDVGHDSAGPVDAWAENWPSGPIETMRVVGGIYSNSI